MRLHTRYVAAFTPRAKMIAMIARYAAMVSSSGHAFATAEAEERLVAGALFAISSRYSASILHARAAR